MDGLVQEIFVKVVVDVLVSETSCRATGTTVAPVVVVVGNVQVAFVDFAEHVRVANEG